MLPGETIDYGKKLTDVVGALLINRTLEEIRFRFYKDTLELHLTRVARTSRIDGDALTYWLRTIGCWLLADD